MRANSSRAVRYIKAVEYLLRRGSGIVLPVMEKLNGVEAMSGA